MSNINVLNTSPFEKPLICHYLNLSNIDIIYHAIHLSKILSYASQKSKLLQYPWCLYRHRPWSADNDSVCNVGNLRPVLQWVVSSPTIWINLASFFNRRFYDGNQSIFVSFFYDMRPYTLLIPFSFIPKTHVSYIK